MIVVRNVFQLKFGTAKEAREIMLQGRAVMEKAGVAPGRALTDVSGPFYTLVLENTFADFAAMETERQKIFGNPEWQAWYKKLSALIVSGHREIYNVLA